MGLWLADMLGFSLIPAVFLWAGVVSLVRCFVTSGAPLGWRRGGLLLAACWGTTFVLDALTENRLMTAAGALALLGFAAGIVVPVGAYGYARGRAWWRARRRKKEENP